MLMVCLMNFGATSSLDTTPKEKIYILVVFNFILGGYT